VDLLGLRGIGGQKTEILSCNCQKRQKEAGQRILDLGLDLLGWTLKNKNV